MGQAKGHPTNSEILLCGIELTDEFKIVNEHPYVNGLRAGYTRLSALTQAYYDLLIENGITIPSEASIRNSLW
mgnify:CR=1 FL=1